jgi:hypothetical protein
MICYNMLVGLITITASFKKLRMQELRLRSGNDFIFRVPDS